MNPLNLTRWLPDFSRPRPSLESRLKAKIKEAQRQHKPTRHLRSALYEAVHADLARSTGRDLSIPKAPYNQSFVSRRPTPIRQGEGAG